MPQFKTAEGLTQEEIQQINSGNIAATPQQIWRALHDYDDPQLLADEQADIARLFRERYRVYTTNNA